ncbi:MAG: DUF4239 domain-containing protein [Cyanobacteria bacterium HKST-UBA02]|nr:DUF4239 domain-containing protein [Cyanobacteria bacterium HKST-UBA02]
MSTLLLGIIVVSVSTVLAVAGMLIVRKALGLDKLKSFHEVSGDMLSVIGTLYAVLLGFVVVDAMTHMQEMRLTVEQEANAAANIYLAADGLPSASCERIQGQCAEYVDLVTNQEWTAMTHGEGIDEAHVVTWKLWHEATHIEAESEGMGTIKDRILEEISNLSDNRRTRLVMARHGVAPTMWFFLIVGGVITVIFTYFFGLECIKTQAIMTALIALTLSLNVFLVYLFGYPFSGDVAVFPDAFELDKKIFSEFHTVIKDGNGSQ